MCASKPLNSMEKLNFSILQVFEAALWVAYQVIHSSSVVSLMVAYHEILL